MRWCVFFALLNLNLLTFIQTAIQLSVSSLQPYMSNIFPELSSWQVILPSLLFPLIFIPLGPITTLINRRISVLTTMTFFSVVMLTGSMLRYCFANTYHSYLGGTFLVALSRPFIFNNVSLISQRLVSPNYQGTFNGFVAAIGSFAGAFGWLLIPYLVSNAESASDNLLKLELVFIILEGDLSPTVYCHPCGGLHSKDIRRGRKMSGYHDPCENLNLSPRTACRGKRSVGC